MFTAAGQRGYVAEKAEGATGWLFPVGDEIHELGYVNMFTNMLDALDNKEEPMETFYDGYIVNEIMDACYRSVRSKQWEAVKLEVWRGGENPGEKIGPMDYDEHYFLMKEEQMPDGSIKLILKDKKSGKIIQKIKEKN